MHAFLIDPHTNTITTVEYNGDFREIYTLIRAPMFDVVTIDKNDAIFVDDEGLFRLNQAYFAYDGHQLAGYGLVLGTDDEGDSIEPANTLEELTSRITWLKTPKPIPPIQVVSLEDFAPEWFARIHNNPEQDA